MTDNSDFSNAFSNAFQKPAASADKGKEQPSAPAAAPPPSPAAQQPPAPAPKTPPPAASAPATPPPEAGFEPLGFANLSLDEAGAPLESVKPTGHSVQLETLDHPPPVKPAPKAAAAPAQPAPPSPSAEPPPAAKPAAAKETAKAAAAPPADVPAPAAPQPEDTGGKPRLRLGERLIQLGMISEDQLRIALQEQKTSKKLLGAILADMGFVTEAALTDVMAESAGAQRFNPKNAVLDTALIRAIPKEVATRQKVLAVELADDTLKLAMADVYNVIALDQARRYFPKQVRVIPVFCAESEILELIDQYYDYEMSIDGILHEIETGIRDKSVQLSGENDGYTNPTVRLVNAILVDAIKQGASDIHFEPEGNFLRLRYRIDGALQQIRSFHNDYWAAIAVRIKIMSGMNIAETRHPQDGRIAYTVTGREVDFRVATQPTVHGENIVMRLLDKDKSLVPLKDLGFSEHAIGALKKMLKRPEGIIIVTGPTGSGKTTTLYSVLSYINSLDVNIMTLEDPVEYQLPLIRQSNVREGSMDFISGIKSLMRQDPDIIFVGEVRDKDTAMMSIRAALTGHQVYTTLHTNDALGAIPRLVDIGVPPHMLAGSLIGVQAQRLARKLCPHCKKPRLATAEECHILGYEEEDAPTIHTAVGCNRCNNKGYKGRVAICEILVLDREMDELIAKSATRKALMEYALENGFVRMVDDGIDKVINGIIDLPELTGTIDMTERM